MVTGPKVGITVPGWVINLVVSVASVMVEAAGGCTSVTVNVRVTAGCVLVLKAVLKAELTMVKLAVTWVKKVPVGTTLSSVVTMVVA